MDYINTCCHMGHIYSYYGVRKKTPEVQYKPIPSPLGIDNCLSQFLKIVVKHI